MDFSTHPYVRATRYTVNAVPESMEQAYAWAITVEYRGNDLWAVVNGPQCLSSDGTWGYEPMSSSRTEQWINKNRFPLDHALELATAAAPDVVVSGHRAGDVAAVLDAWRLITRHTTEETP